MIAPFPSILHPQITDGCAGHVPGDTQFTFKLTVNTLNDDTQGFYRVSFSNVGGSVDEPASRVTGRGKTAIYIHVIACVGRLMSIVEALYFLWLLLTTCTEHGIGTVERIVQTAY